MKQVKEIQMGAFIFNGAPGNQVAFREFQGYPVLFEVWNVDFMYQSDFLGGAVTSALTGYNRGNPMGHRPQCRINLRNTLPSESEAIRSLLNLFSSRYDRIFWNFSGGISSVSGTSATLPSAAPNVSNFFVGTVLRNHTLGQERVIIAYSSSRIATLDSSVSGWSSGHNYRVMVRPNFPTILGVSTDDTSGNISFYNIDSSTFGINRELTVGNQIIQLNLTGVYSEQEIKSGHVI